VGIATSVILLLVFVLQVLCLIALLVIGGREVQRIKTGPIRGGKELVHDQLIRTLLPQLLDAGICSAQRNYKSKIDLPYS